MENKETEHLHNFKYTECTVRQMCSCGLYKEDFEKFTLLKQTPTIATTSTQPIQEPVRVEEVRSAEEDEIRKFINSLPTEGPYWKSALLNILEDSQFKK